MLRDSVVGGSKGPNGEWTRVTRMPIGITREFMVSPATCQLVNTLHHSLRLAYCPQVPVLPMQWAWGSLGICPEGPGP